MRSISTPRVVVKHTPRQQSKTTNKTEWSDPLVRVQIVNIFVVIATGSLIYLQVGANITTNKMAMRGQLYQYEADNTREARANDVLHNIWLTVPNKVTGFNYSRSLLSTLTTDTAIQNVRSPEELYDKVWGYNTMTNPARAEETKKLRLAFTSAQSELYHIHNAFDYSEEDIMDKQEWETWKGSIREMSAHPLFVTAVWQGYQYQYFSREFAKFLQDEICSPIPINVTDKADYFRDLDFIRKFYPEMTKPNWHMAMPSYKE